MLCLLERLPQFSDLKFQISNLKLQAENISRQLRAWADSLQNSEIKGQRYLTDKSRRLAKAKREREEFMGELRRMQEGNLRSLESRTAGDEGRMSDEE
jgi:predicted  nucleic acid-binding Zn-ribbon protein